ncbi:MAG: HAD family phosphatase [Bryobacteraceae bacterium]
MKTDVLFDLDGTLVDSAGLHARAFREALEPLWPQALAEFDYERVRGLATQEAFALLGASDAERLARLASAKRTRYRELVEEGRLRTFPGALELLEDLSSAGRRLYVVSSGSKESVTAALKASGLRGYFHGVVTCEDVPHAKPAPDLYLAALNRFRLDRAGCVAVEDAASGVAACKAAEIDVIVVNNPVLGASAEISAADLAALRRMLL